MKRVMILNGPNLNLLGVREPHIYGATTLAQIKENCEARAEKLGLKIAFHQSNHEGVIVDLIQSARQEADAVIINPAGFSFTSVAVMDAIRPSRDRCSRCTSPIYTPATNIIATRKSRSWPPA